jgi:hypothetical protein
MTNLSDLIYPLSIAIAILLLSLYLYFSWSSVIDRAVKDINDLTANIKARKFISDDQFSTTIEATKSGRIKDLLLECKRNLITINGDLGPEKYCLKPYSDIWSARKVLAGKMNLSLYETMPNLLIGAGLMFTFIFLALALTEAGTAMKGTGDTQKRALEELIATAGGKFITSIAGLVSSLIWNWAAKVSIEKLESAIDELEVNLRTIASDNAPQAVIHAQLSIFNEILYENREQVGQLKKFETDIAVAIAKAIGNALQPAFDKLGQELIQSLNTLSERISSINEDALKEVMEKFLDGIRGSSAQEMENFKRTLDDLSNKLDAAGNNIGTRIGDAGAAFGNSVEILEKTITKTNETVTKLDLSLEKAKDIAGEGSSMLEGVVNGLVAAVSGVGNVITDVDAFLKKIESSTESLNLVADSLDNTVASQKVISEEFKLGIPSMSNALKDAINQINLGTTASREALSSLRADFETTRESVDNTVIQLTSGLADYSDKVANLHSTLDEKLAQAVSSINSTIVTLEETMDDFIESLPKAK